MKLVGVLGMILGGAMVMACGTPQTGAARAPSDVMEVLHAELARTIGTTTLTSATVPSRNAGAVNPPYLSIEAEQAPAPQTWGAAAPPSEQDDLARNPYTEQDIYDPR